MGGACHHRKSGDVCAGSVAVRASHGAGRQVGAIQEHDGESLPSGRELAEAGEHPARSGHRNYSRRERRRLVTPSIRPAVGAHRWGRQRGQDHGRGHVRYRSRILSRPGWKFLGRGQRPVQCRQSRGCEESLRGPQVQPRGQAAVDHRQSGRPEIRRRHVHRSGGLHQRAERRHHHCRRASSASADRRGRSPRAVFQRRQVPPRLRQTGHRPRRIHGAALARLRFAGQALRRRPVEQSQSRSSTKT